MIDRELARDIDFVVGKAIINQMEEANRNRLELDDKQSLYDAAHLYELYNYPTPYLSKDDEDLTRRK